MFVSVLTIALALVQNPTGDIQQGKQLFEGLCADCHGFEGTGGRGPNLNRAVLPRAQDDESLLAIIRDGIPDRGMPRVRRTTGNEQRQLAAYVRSLGRAARGAAWRQCAKRSRPLSEQCLRDVPHDQRRRWNHGPELTTIGLQRGPDYLRQALIDPAAALPHGTLPVPSRNLDEFLPVRVITQDGHEVRGARINEDTFTIQLRDSNGEFHSFRKAELRQIEKEFGKSLMPSFKDRLNASAVDDLVAYLVSLGGAK